MCDEYLDNDLTDVDGDLELPTRAVPRPSAIGLAIDELLLTLATKNADYTGDYSEFFNFESSAIAAGIEVDDVFKVLLAVKEGRIAALASATHSPNHEALLDSYKDFAGYAVLRYAYHLSQQEN